jgi:hypothetical protein
MTVKQRSPKYERRWWQLNIKEEPMKFEIEGRGAVLGILALIFGLAALVVYQAAIIQLQDKVSTLTVQNTQLKNCNKTNISTTQ